MDYIGYSDSVISYNVFAYCENEPVLRDDPSGCYGSALVISSSLTATLSGALSGIMTGISATVASIKTAIASSWFVPVCVAAVAVAIAGIVVVVNRVNYLIASAKEIISAVKSKVKTGGLDPKKLKDYTVYVIVRKGTTDVVYVGITKNYSARKSSHTGDGKRFSISKYTMMPIATNLSKAKARVLEQTIITAYTLDTLKNMINSISPKKWNNFKLEFEQINTLIQSWKDPE